MLVARTAQICSAHSPFTKRAKTGRHVASRHIRSRPLWTTLDRQAGPADFRLTVIGQWHVTIGAFCFHSTAAIAGAKDPKALETLVNSMNVKTESVNRDLTAYKGILSKLNAAKELMAELMAREKRKQEER